MLKTALLKSVKKQTHVFSSFGKYCCEKTIKTVSKHILKETHFLS